MYKPNVSDPRVLKRIRKAYGFTKGCLSTEKSQAWAKVVIDKYFGQQQHDLSKYLRNTLLICTNDRYDKERGETKQYKSNLNGLEYFKGLLYGSEKTKFVKWTEDNGLKNINSLTSISPSVSLLFDHYCVNKFVEEEYGQELNSLNFEYSDKSNRLWHPIQNIKKEHKRTIFQSHGLNFQYDIETCAPSLLHQYSQKLDMDLYLFALRKYLKDKQVIRTQIAKELEIDRKTVKVIINALFCGARIGNSSTFAISKLVNNDPAKIQFLKENQFISQLRDDIKTCWDYIEPSMAKAYKDDKSGKPRKIAITSKKKWQVYFELERQVLNQVRNYLELTNNRYFLEHDGWATEHQINEHELNQYIKDKTGFNVKFQMEQLKNINSLTSISPSVSLLYGNLTNDINNLKEVLNASK